MVQFKERVTTDGCNKHIFNPIKRKKMGKFWRYSEKNNKDEIDGKTKDIVEQIFWLLVAKSDQSVSAIDIKNALSFPLASISVLLASADSAIWKANLYGPIDSPSNHNISLENYTGVN